MMEAYLKSVQHQLAYYKKIGEQAMAQLSDAELFWQYNTESNSIAIIVKHLSGNMISRWTDFFTSDGEKENRHRDIEFIPDFSSRAEVLACWDQGWNCFLGVINALKEEDLSKEVTIRQEKHTVIAAINRQLAHYPYHIGQIVFIGKMLRATDWQSLSIPKGKSADYNAKTITKNQS
ncbi:DUF1572 domain-containing protein [Pedobacter gandavensis]|uniref:DUF1572 domain-containing protein n=1 Tax=Pedobacter gandavensis TaxID=2679963 RepID=A0ABR6F1A7_9SPHI|nr:DUF1572 domain-containing protein [Pedobacter gandavensis]MBB2150448.1 DUF1572 domain-containing protein [Pedobacter gandavensis]